MKTITHSNGVVSTYDETFQPGDLITAYHKGIFRFVKYEERPGNTPIVYSEKMYDAEANPKKSVKLEICDASYCQHAVVWMSNEIARLEGIISRMEKLL